MLENRLNISLGLLHCLFCVLCPILPTTNNKYEIRIAKLTYEMSNKRSISFEISQ